MIRSVWISVNVFIATLILGPPLIIGGLLGVRSPRFLDFWGTTWSRWILLVSGTRVQVEGRENLDPASPQVLVGNHQSWYDVFTLASHVGKRYHFVAKKELERIPVFGRAWKAAGHISIDRSDQSSAIASLDRAGRQLREEGSAVIIFPEGTRSPDDDLLPFKKGAFMLAIHTGVPIVPFAVSGSRRVLPKGGWRVRPGRIILRFGRPIPTADMRPQDREALMQRVRREVLRLRDQGRRELGPGKLEAPESSNA